MDGKPLVCSYCGSPVFVWFSTGEPLEIWCEDDRRCGAEWDADGQVKALPWSQRVNGPRSA